MSVRIFLSTVSDEFRAYRDALRHELTRPNVEVKIQEDFKDLGGDTLDKLDGYIAHCDAVVHLVGDMTGSAPEELPLRALRAKYPDLADKLPPLGEALRSRISPSYTQWEAWLALYHDKHLFIVKAEDAAERESSYAPTEASRAAQVAHLAGLRKAGRYPGHSFASPADLTKYIYSTGILELLVQAYGKEMARACDVAEGFIHEMAKKVAGDQALDLEGMQQAVRNAIDLYEKEIAGGQTRTNIDAIVDEALARARSLVDTGKSGLARAALRKAADSMQREEEERRERYVEGVTVLYHRARDIALAAYDGEAAAEAIIALAEAVHGANVAMVAQSLNSEAAVLYEYGRDRGSNVHLVALITLRRKLLDAASPGDERGRAHGNLSVALVSLGERESSTARLEEAVAADRQALRELTRERVPLDWAKTQNNLGTALATLGERERDTARLEEAVAAYREALKEWTCERVPFDWAMTQNNLGNAFARLGELEEAIAAYREALKEWPRDRLPLKWATTQSNLGTALSMLGERESGTARLEEAIVAFREALKERTRERVPLDWAHTQDNLGNAFARLGERESGTARLEEAVAAHRNALKEWTRENAPHYHGIAQRNLDRTLKLLEERTTRKQSEPHDEGCG